MSQNKFTTNNDPTLAAVSNADGETPVYLYADPVTHEVLTKTTSGTGSSASEVKVTDGTNIVSVLKSDGTAAGQNAELVAGAYLSVPFTTTTVQAVGTTDAGNYNSVSVEINSQGTSSVVTFQVSDDNINWRSITLYTSTNFSATATTTQTVSSFAGPLAQRYFRLSVTGISAGTTSGVIVFKSLPYSQPVTTVSSAQSGTWTVGANSATGSTIPSNAFFMGGASPVSGNLIGLQTGFASSNVTGSSNLATVLMAQFDDISPLVITENNFGNVRMNTVRALYCENGPYILGRATGDTQIKSSAGFIHTICISPLTATPTAGLLTIYDSLTETGTVIYSEWVTATSVGHTITLDLPTATGIYVGFDATLANVQATVSYR